MSRHCDAYQCATPVLSGRFLCVRHWRMVPLPTQRTINERFRAGRADFAFLEDTAYLEACVSAIAGIATAEGHSSAAADAQTIAAESPYGRLLRVAQRKQGGA